MTLRIIDNKKVELTDHEWNFYQELCDSYDQGKELFRDLFETDGDGIIIFLRPPSKRFTSIEIIYFLQSVMLHQHIRVMYKDVDALISEGNKVINEAKSLLNSIKESRDANNGT